MPTKDAHVNWATHNRSFWTSIDLETSPYIDWAITGMFYESVHWVEAFLATKSHHSTAHDKRKRDMVSYKLELRPMWNNYIKLETDSRNARYDCYKHTAEEARQLIPLVDHIKDHTARLIPI